MQSQNRIFEDMSKIATSAMGTMGGRWPRGRDDDPRPRP